MHSGAEEAWTVTYGTPTQSFLIRVKSVWIETWARWQQRCKGQGLNLTVSEVPSESEVL